MTIPSDHPVNNEISLLKDIAAPSPRYLMRLSHVEKLIRSLPATPASFLEIGPGMGDVSSYLMKRYPGIRGHVTDTSQDSIDIVNRRLMGHDNLTLAVSDFTLMPGSGNFDLIVACEVFEHLHDDNAAFATVHRLLADVGYFLFSVPAFMKKWGSADLYGGHVRRYEKDLLRQQFADHGFQIVHFWAYGFPVTNLISPLSRFYYHMAQKRSPLTQQQSTNRSGTERRLVIRLRRLFNRTLMKPFFLCQDLFKECNLGDGYVVLAKKK